MASIRRPDPYEIAYDELLPSYPKSSADYLKSITIIDHGVALDAYLIEVKGHRKTQEDCMVVDLLDEAFKTLPQKVRHLVFKNTIEKMQQQFQHCDSGSTLTMAYSWLDRTNKLFMVDAALLGDSEANVVVYNHNTKQSKFYKLFKELHNPNTPSETKRITNEGGIIEDGKIITPNQYIRVSRSIGDAEVLTRSSDHEAEIKTFQIRINPETETAFLLLFCDGLRENSACSDQDLCTFFSKNYNGSLLSLADTLSKIIEHALHASRDNISLAVLPNGGFGAIMDGHGGPEVSTGMGENILNVLRDQIQFEIQQQMLAAPEKDTDNYKFVSFAISLEEKLSKLKNYIRNDSLITDLRLCIKENFAVSYKNLYALVNSFTPPKRIGLFNEAAKTDTVIYELQHIFHKEDVSPEEAKEQCLALNKFAKEFNLEYERRMPK